MKRWLILAALALTLAVPFVLHPKRGGSQLFNETLVIVTPHNEAIRYELGRGFRDWYQRQTGKTVSIDWRVIGGTSEIAQFLEGEYVASFQFYWTKILGKAWSTDVQAGFQSPILAADVAPLVKEARETFLKSEVGCGIDLFFGGGPYDFIRQALVGRIVDSGILQRHPEWFNDRVIPHTFAGEEYWDEGGRWVGTVLSNYGMIANVDAIKRLGVSLPLSQWEDLANPKMAGEVALADPTKSSSIAKAFENIIQQQMQRRLDALLSAEPAQDPAAREARAVTEGWMTGLRQLQLMSANSRYFTDTSQKPPIDVAQGNSAIGICIDFYGRQQEEAVRRRAQSSRLTFVLPSGGTVSSVDPIALLRGAKNREIALAFLDFTLSMEGQKLWNFRPGTPEGTQRYALRRLPIRRDFYEHAEFKEFQSDPSDSPYKAVNQLIYREAWTGSLFREMSFVIRVMAIDTHDELVRAWRAIIDAGMPSDALVVLQELSPVDYEAVRGPIKKALNAKSKVNEIRLAHELGEYFREHYRRAEELARGHRRVR